MMRCIFLWALYPLTCFGFEFGLSFPPVADDSQRAFTAEHLDALNVHRLRFAEHWGLREPSPGEFNWGPLDDRLQWAEEQGISVLLTIQSNGPDWACGTRNDQSCVFLKESDFRTFVRALLQRHPNRIDKIQFGNEWNDTFNYVGSAADYVRFNNILYEEVQVESASTHVVLGGLSIGAMTALSACTGRIDEVCDDGNILTGSEIDEACNEIYPDLLARVQTVLNQARYDLLDIHLYDDAENWAEHLAAIREIAPNKPILVSEFGGPNIFCEDSDPDHQAERLEVYLATLCQLGDIEEAYFFKLVERGDGSAHERSGLIDTDLNLKPAYSVFQRRESFCSTQSVRNSTWLLR